MIYRVLADVVVVAHLLFILFVVFGGLLALRYRWMPWVHIPAAAWGAAIELFGWLCPLTPIENSLRRASGATGYSGGFIEHYIVPLIYPSQLSRELQFGLAGALVLFNVAIYILVWRRRRHSAAESVGDTVDCR